MADEHPPPARIMQIATGGWATATLAAAVHHGLFDACRGDGATAAEVTVRTGIAPRGARALLDGATGLGFLTVAAGRYRNAPDAEQFLVRSSRAYAGGFAELMGRELASWADVFEVASAGRPPADEFAQPENPFWEQLVPAIAVLSVPVAQRAAGELGVAKAGACRWLDVGGGSGIWSAIWLGTNPQARATQLDWANVNRLARGFVGNFGVADRFDTIDGDFRTTPLTGAAYDFIIFSHIAHGESPDGNLALFRKFRAALKPGGALVVNDFVVADDRSGPPFPLLFAVNMLMHTSEGSTYTGVDYRAWMSEAGFGDVRLVETGTPATLVIGR